jgi:hypothetical protein
MDERSTLGPIDPQIIITTPQGATSIPVQDILDGFERIRGILKDDPGSLGAFLPMLQKYDLYIFEICENAKKLARSLAQEWLEKYMLKNVSDRKEKASFIADKLAEHKEYLSHGRTIGIEKCKELGLNIKDLRESPELRNEAWRLYCLIELLFDRTPNVKLFENSTGTSWARNFMEQIIQVPIPPPQTPAPVQPHPQNIDNVSQRKNQHVHIAVYPPELYILVLMCLEILLGTENLDLIKMGYVVA